MRAFRSSTTVAVVVLATWLVGSAGIRAQDQVPPPPPDAVPAPDAAPALPQGMDVLTSGPIHEAFAAPVTTQPQATPAVPKAPPPLIDEVPADQRPAGDNVVWIPGYWGWDPVRSDFIWVSGFWRVPPPGRQWIPGHWDQAGDGWHWVPGFWGDQQQTQIAYLPPPPAPIEATPSVPAPSAQAIYEPGSWVWASDHYAWRPGYWVNYQPGWVWVPAHFVWTPSGCVFVEGYWDFPLQQRGVLFTPVYLTAQLYSQPNFLYRPYYVVRDLALLGALFVRPAAYHYYFGDYFTPQYQRLGFTPWFDYRFGRQGYDPLFSYYRFAQPDQGRWVQSLRELYTARYNGTAPRPPRTWAQQQTLIAANRNVAGNSMHSLAMVTPITKVSPSVVKLQPVSPQAQAAEQRLVQQYRQASQQRQRLEAQVRAQAPTARESRPVHVNTPRVPAPKTVHAVQAPATPARPQLQHHAAPATRPVERPQTGVPAQRPQPGAPAAHTQPRPPAQPQPNVPHAAPPSRPAERPPQAAHPQPVPHVPSQPPSRPAERPPQVAHHQPVPHAATPAPAHPAPAIHPQAPPHQPAPPAHPQTRPAPAPSRPPANPRPAPPPHERNPAHEKK